MLNLEAQVLTYILSLFTSFVALSFILSLSLTSIRREIEGKSVLPYGIKGTAFILIGSFILIITIGEILSYLLIYKVLIINILECILACVGVLLIILGVKSKGS